MTYKERLEETLGREEIEIAPLWKRVVAFLIDDLLMSLVYTAIYGGNIQIDAENMQEAIVVLYWLLLVVVTINLVYHWVFVALYGATIGKMVVRIRVIEVELLDNPKWQRAFVRSCFRLVSRFLMYIPFLLALENSLRLTMHDRIAKTAVVNLKQ